MPLLTVIFFLALSILWYMFLRGVFAKRIKLQEGKSAQLLDQLNNLAKLKERFDLENTRLNAIFEETLALYELTKDICKSMEEEKIFAIFHTSLKKYIDIGDCRYIKEAADLIKYKEYMILP